MVFLVPFDGSAASEAALERAIEHGKALGCDVVAVSFVPTGETYAERRKWIEPSEAFAVETASAELRRKIEETTDRAERNFTDPGAEARGSGVSRHVRQVASDVGANVVFVGVSDDYTGEDGQLTAFGGVSRDAPYDLHLVRTGQSS
jgi:nucleotide-binding universal stress UspA family protein